MANLEKRRTVVLERFKRNVIEQSKRNLISLGKDGGRLIESIDGKIEVFPNSVGIEFFMEDYGEFQDKGVKGVKSGESKAGYSYKDKMPPPSKFDAWTVRKGIAPRDSKGKFMSRKSLNFAIAKSVFNHGIKPSQFFTKAFETAFRKLPDDLILDYGLQAEEQFLFMLDNKK
jgi:hypothetical protein